MAITITEGIHNGAVTHHHDQLATAPIPVSFKIRNTMNINVHIPIPELELEFLLIFKYLNC